MYKMRKNFAFSRTSHSAQSNSSAGDVFCFLIFPFSMQIHSFPFWWYVSNFPDLVIFSGFHYATLPYFWKVVILHSFFERWIKFWSKDNRDIKNMQKKKIIFFTTCAIKTDPNLALCRKLLCWLVCLLVGLLVGPLLNARSMQLMAIGLVFSDWSF